MSLNVLVIPEDYRKDQYIARPIARALVMEAGGSKATVQVCQNPLLGGIREALKVERLAAIVRTYPMVDVFLLCVDRDADPNRVDQLARLERELLPTMRPGQILLAEHAWQELEVWLLAAARDLPARWSWSEIRSARDPKESYFRPYAKSQGVANGPGEGRKVLGERAAGEYRRVRSLCSEDVEFLEGRLRAWLRERPSGDARSNWLRSSRPAR